MSNSLNNQRYLSVINLRTKGERLEWVRKQLGLTRQEAKTRTGMALSTYSAYENAERGRTGSRNFSYEQAEDITKKLGAPSAAHWIYTGKGNPPPLAGGSGAGPSPSGSPAAVTRTATPPRATAKPPRPAATRIVGYVGASSGEGALYGFAHDQYDEIDAPPFANPNTVAVEIKGKSFGPLMEGMLVFYDDVRRPITDDLVGSICVVGLADSRILLKKIVRKNGGFQLLSNNHLDPPIEDADIVWAAKMIAIAPRF